MTERFGTLRSILQRPPNKQTWDALCEELALWDADALERDAVPYALSHLDRWPDDLARVTTQSALFDWHTNGRIEPALRLANHATITDVDDLMALASSPFAARIRTVELRCSGLTAHNASEAAAALMAMPLRSLIVDNHNMSDKAAAEPLERMIEAMELEDLHDLSLLLSQREQVRLARIIAAAPQWASLRSLVWTSMCGKPSHIDLSTLAASPHLTRLTSLSLSGVQVDWHLKALLNGPLLNMLERLTLNGTDLQYPSVIQLVQSPKLARLTHLGISGELGPATAQAIASSAHMARLTSLDLSGIRCSAAGCHALATSPHLARLEKLRLSDTDGIGAIFSSDHLRALRTFEIHECRIDEECAIQIADADWPPALEAPKWDNQYLSDDAARALARSPNLARTTDLDLSTHYITPTTMAALLASPHLTGLRKLNLYYEEEDDASEQPLLVALQNPALAMLDELQVSIPHTDLTRALLAPDNQLRNLTILRSRGRIADETLLALVRSTLIKNLTHLTLWIHELGADSVSALMQSPHTAKLRHLNLADGDLSDEAALAIAHASTLAGLKTLKLTCYIAQPTTIAALVHNPHLQQLTLLNINGDFGVEGLTAIAHSPLLLRHNVGVWGEQWDCRLDNKQITADTLPILLDSPYLCQLTSLQLAYNPLGDAGAAVLAAHPALLHLERLDLASSEITLEGVRILAASPTIRNLWELKLHMSDYTQNKEADAILLTSPHLHPILRAHLQARQR